MFPPSHHHWISRKEISLITGLPVETIRRSEHHLGLDQFKVQPNPRVVIYHREEVIELLEGMDLIVEVTTFGTV